MTKPRPKLTVDQAVARFQVIAREVVAERQARGERPPECRPFETPEEEEARRFGLAEHLIRLVCPDPGACPEHGCRRSGRCRHLVRVRQKRQQVGWSKQSRRPPGAEAARYAVWVYMNKLARPQPQDTPADRPGPSALPKPIALAKNAARSPP